MPVPDRIDFGSYRYRTLSHMLAYLKRVELPGVRKKVVKDIIDALTRASRLRPSFGSRTDPERRSFVRVQWTNVQLQKIGLKAVLLKPEIMAHLRDDIADDMEDLQIAKKLVVPIGANILNFSSVARNLPQLREGDDCPCRRYDLKFRPDGGCVRTGDVDIIPNAALRQLVIYGPRFREHAQEHPLDAIHEGLAGYMKYLKRTKVIDSMAEMAAWRQAVMDECEHRLGIYNAADVPRPLLQQPEIKRSLSLLQQHLVFVPVDKAANNIGIVCKAEYSRVIHKELEREGGAYEQVDDTQDAILAQHREELGGFMGSDKLPYL